MVNVELRRMQVAADADKDIAKYRKVEPLEGKVRREGTPLIVRVFDFTKQGEGIIVHIAEEVRLGLGGQLIVRTKFTDSNELLRTIPDLKLI